MTGTRTHLPKKRSFLAGCLSHLVFAAIVIVLLVGGGYIYLQNYLQQYIGEIPTSTVTQVDNSQKQSIKVVFNRETTNLMLSRLIEQNPDMDFSIKWQEDQLLAETTVFYNGLNLPVEIRADLVVSADDYFQIVIESIKLAEFPLPTATAYELVASQLVLPDWLIFNSDQPIIDVDLKQIPIDQSNISLSAATSDLANDAITIEVFYDAETFDLLSYLQFEQ